MWLYAAISHINKSWRWRSKSYDKYFVHIIISEEVVCLLHTMGDLSHLSYYTVT